jgi:hypothetical protein
MDCEHAYGVPVPRSQRMGVPSATFWTISTDLLWMVATAMSLTGVSPTIRSLTLQVVGIAVPDTDYSVVASGDDDFAVAGGSRC